VSWTVGFKNGAGDISPSRYQIVDLADRRGQKEPGVISVS